MSGTGEDAGLPEAAAPGTRAPGSGAYRERGLPRRLGKNVITYYVTFGAGAVVALLTTPILVHQLGTTRYGIWALVGSVVVYLELFELGFGAATTKLVAEDAKRRNAAVVRTLNTNLFVLALFGLVAIAVGSALAPVAVDWLGIPADLRGQARIALLIMTVAVAVSIPFDALGGGLAAFERIDLLSTSNLVRGLAASIGGALAAVLGGGIVGVTAVTAAAGISVHYLRWRMLKRLVPELRLSPRLIERPKFRTTLRLSGWFMLRDVTTVVITRLDLVIVGVMLDLRAVALYAVALKLSQIAIRALQPFTELFFPRASALSAQRNVTGLADLLVDGTRISLVVVTPLMLILALLAHPALIAWLGPGFDDAVSVLVLLALARGLTSVTETAWWMLGGAGYIKRTSTLSVVEAVVNMGSSIALAPVMGPAGVAAGSLIGVVCARLPVALTVSGRLTGLSTACIARRALLPHLLPAALVAALLLLTSPVLPAAPIPVLAVAAGACLLYFTAYLVVGATPPERARLRAATRCLGRPGSTDVAAGRHRRATVVSENRGRVPAPQTLVGQNLGASAGTVVAVCVCTYQRPLGLARFLTRLAAVQPCGVSSVDDEQICVKVVVVDNEPGGPRRDAVEAFAAYWPGSVQYAVEPLRGIAQARNRAVWTALPDTDFVVFADDDEVPEAGWIQELLRMQRRTAADVVVGPVLRRFVAPPPAWIVTGRFFERPRHIDGQQIHYGWTSNVLIKKDVFEVADPPFDERLGLAGGEDTLFFQQAQLAGRRIVWADRALVTEYVPSTRCHPGWLLRREYRRGNTLSICMVESHAPVRRRVKRVGRAAVALLHGLMLVLLMTPLLGRRAAVKGGQRICFAAGLITGMLGLIYEEYRHGHGS